MTGLAARPRSLQGRLLAGVLAVVAGVWLAATALSWRDVSHELDELLDAHLAQAAALLVVQQSAGLEHDDDRVLDAPVLHRYAPRVAFQVFHEGQLVLRSALAPREPLATPAALAAGGYVTAPRDGARWRVFAAQGAQGDVRVLVAERVDARAEILAAVLFGMLWPLALALPVLGALAWWSVRRTLQPLRRLGGQLAQRRAQALDALPVDGLPSEVQPLVDALNGLFGRIEALMANERRFTADAAHELRTPIAAIRAQAQVALAEPDAALRRHALQATLAGCDRATRLVEQLLTLSRLDAGAALSAQPLDLSAIARDVVAELAPQALARGQDLGLDAPLPCPLRGDATLLAALLRNLVDNALRYGSAGTRVTVVLTPHEGDTTLSVLDDGPGLPAADRARLGQRFFRGLGQGQQGSGLGWSIVRRIAEVHGFSVDVAAASVQGGLAVRLHRRADAGPS